MIALFFFLCYYGIENRGMFMILYLLHDDIITTFELPLDIKGSYILSDNKDNQFKNLINIVGENGKWIACSNDDVKIFYMDKR